MSERKPRLLLEDILESAEKIIIYTDGLTYNDFIIDSRTIDAVVRNFEIIGEAAARLPENFKNEQSQIDWHKLKGLRNRIVHHYFGIDYSIIWSIKENLLNDLIKDIKIILKKS
jgi:uncharacterized protein with HEPN domain